MSNAFFQGGRTNFWEDFAFPAPPWWRACPGCAFACCLAKGEI